MPVCNSRWGNLRPVSFLVGALLLALAAGCAEQPKIEQYTVARTVAAPAVAAVGEQVGDSRMLGGIVIAGEQGWFLKLQGPDAAVSKLSKPFREFVASIKIPAAGGNITWTTPEGWKEEGPTGLRFATLIAPSAEGATPIELSISKLPYQADSENEYLLANFNRWRGQLSLPPITEADLPTSSERIKLESGEAVIVDIVGAASASNAMTGPFAGGPRMSGSPPFAGPGAAVPPVGPVAGTGGNSDGDITYKVPEGWTEQPITSSLRKASLSVGIGDKQAEITVIPLGGQAGDWLSNVNRWRGQVQLNATTEEELAKVAKTIEVDGVKGNYVELVGEESGKTILGVMVVKDDVSWFVKFTGPSSLAADEREHFEQFTRSIKWK